MILRTVLPVFLLGIILSLVAIPAAIRLAHRWNMLDLPGQHKRHKRPVPILGGPALFICFWLSLVPILLFNSEGMADIIKFLPYAFAGSLVIVLIGLSDDLTPLSAWVKLGAQIGAGLILYMGDMKIDPLSIPFIGSIETGPMAPFITVGWVVALTNAINLIDGLDGLASGVSIIAAGSMSVVGIYYNNWSVVVLATALIGFLIIFMVYNRYPARIFLGDSGSLQIGFYFAIISLLVPIRTFTASALYLPLLTLGVPLLEIGISFSRRLLSGKPVMGADRRHLFHYLSLAGLSRSRIVMIFYLVSLIFGLFTVGMLFFDRWWVFGFLVLFMVVIFSAFYILLTNLNRPFGRNLMRPKE